MKFSHFAWKVEEYVLVPFVTLSPACFLILYETIPHVLKILAEAMSLQAVLLKRLNIHVFFLSIATKLDNITTQKRKILESRKSVLTFKTFSF